MPFTLAHPAVAWPLAAAARGRLRLAAIVAGTLAPDFYYFAQLRPNGRFSHTVPGLVLFCLPAGWLALFLFDRYGARGVDRILPREWRRRSAVSHQYPALATSLAVLVGAVSHVAWDAFTHVHGAVVEQLPVLTGTVRLGPLAIPWYKLLQHGTGLIALAVLALMALRWTATRPRPSAMSVTGRAAGVVAVLTAAGILNGLRFARRGLEPFMVGAGVAVVFASCVGLVIVGAWDEWRSGSGSEIERAADSQVG